MKDLPERLKRARQVRGHSQEQAARAMNVTASALNKWERGLRAPTGLYAQVVEEYISGSEVKGS